MAPSARPPRPFSSMPDAAGPLLPINRMNVGAIWGNPNDVQNWCRELPSGRAVVVYCVYGHKASQEAASAPRGAGVNASYLEYGIAGWAEYRLPMRSSSTGFLSSGRRLGSRAQRLWRRDQ
jgi:rhodanese-related sulfurtransferase